ncbi:MAG: hypothetical protein M0Z64_08110 [Nitrospiraceae bacterium]|nr:hypothetical protein [Nitrospiraceae bacterium]
MNKEAQALKAVEKEQAPDIRNNPFDMIYEVRCRHEFLAHAIIKLWGNGDSCFCGNDEVIFGCQLLLHDSTAKLDKVLLQLDPEYEPKFTEV